MGKSTISMAMFNSFLYVYQSVPHNFTVFHWMQPARQIGTPFYMSPVAWLVTSPIFFWAPNHARWCPPSDVNGGWLYTPWNTTEIFHPHSSTQVREMLYFHVHQLNAWTRTGAPPCDFWNCMNMNHILGDGISLGFLALQGGCWTAKDV